MRNQRIDWDIVEDGAVLLRINGLIVARFGVKELLTSLHGISGAFLAIMFPAEVQTLHSLTVAQPDEPVILNAPTDDGSAV